VCILGLKLFDRSLCLIQAHCPNSNALWPEVVKEISDALRKAKSIESKIHVRDFNA